MSLEKRKPLLALGLNSSFYPDNLEGVGIEPDPAHEISLAHAARVGSLDWGYGEKKQAASLLVQATSLVEAMPRNSQKLMAQMKVAECYATVEPGQSVALLRPIIVLVNQLVEAASVLDGFENSYLNEGEWMKRGHSNLGNMVNSLGQNLGTLAREDREGARALSNQLGRPEIRLMAQLEIAQNLLRKGSIRQSNFSRMNQIIRKYPASN